MMPVDKKYLQEVWRLINEAHLVLKKDSMIQLYHHRGADHFAETGAVFINVINEDYCKSYAVLLPGQSYPNHYHKIKIESFFVLYGDLHVICEGGEHILTRGELMSVGRGQDHAFYSERGAVFEELSTKYVKNDSVYEDATIRHSSYDQRKTQLPLTMFKEVVQDE